MRRRQIHIRICLHSSPHFPINEPRVFSSPISLATRRRPSLSLPPLLIRSCTPMATPAKEGGMGGPTRRQPFRRAASTPYDRPQAALRGGRRGGLGAEGRGWISKIVDPAHRLISSGASKLFSSMFRKRLTAPPAAQEEDRQSREDVPQIAQIASTIPSSGTQNCNGDNQTCNSDSGGIAEVEQLLKDKTFTRAESDHLAELLRSRTVDTFKAEHEHNDVKKEETSLQAQVGIRSSKEHIPIDEVASPAELAKAYMISRPSKISPSVGSLRNQIFQEDANLRNLPSTSRRLDLSVAPRSVLRISRVRDPPEHGYQTARPAGRSAIYRMSRSPYFKVGELSRDGYSSPSLSQWTPSAVKSGGKQVLKRKSSPSDGDSPSHGPIRRIRQKSNLISTFKDARALSGNFISSPATPLFKGVSMSVQKPLLVDERKYGGIGTRVTENGISNVAMPPSKSSETAQQLFQQLDKLLPSPKERSSEMKTIGRDESPSKLTVDMLHGSALRSMEDINSSKFFNKQGSGKFDTASASHLPDTGDSHSQKLDIVEEKGRLKAVHLEVKLAAETNGVSNAPISFKDAKPGAKSQFLSGASSVALPVATRPAFQMSAPEDPLELDDDDYTTKDLSSSLTIKDDADTKMSKHNDVVSETAISGNPPKASLQSMPIPSSLSSRRADKKAPVQPVVTEKNNGFAFPVASDPCTQSQPPPTPTMPTPLLDKPDAQKEQTSSVSVFGSKGVNSSTFPSTAISTAGIKFGEGSGSELISSSSATTASTDGSTLVKSEIQKAGDTFKSLGNTVSSGVSTPSGPALFAFGSSTAPSLANGSLSSSPPTLPVHDAAADTPSEGHVSSIFGNGVAAASGSGSSVSSAVATFSTAPSFQIGSGISTTATVSVSQPLDKSNLATPEAKSLKASPFDVSGSTVQGISAVFPSFGSSSSSDAATSVTIFSNGGSFPALSPSQMSSDMNNSSSAPSSLFSSMAGSSSSVALSSAFPSTGNGVFGFNATTQPVFSSSSLAHGSSQNSTSNVLDGTGGSTSSIPSFANNSSQNSTASTFSGTGGSIFGTQSSGSIFGTQSSQSGSGASLTTQSSMNQFGSFPSSPSFGLVNSSSGGFGSSSFAPATSGAKPFASSSGFSFSSGIGSSSASSSSSFVPATTTGLFGSSSQAATTSIFSSSSSSNNSSSMGFSFGLSASGSGSSPFTFGSSSTPVFPFTSAGVTAPTSSAQAPAFGLPSPAVGFTSTGNDQMNDDNMTDDTNQSASALVPTFGQPANPPPSQPFMFGSPATQPASLPAFQFGSHQNPSLPQNPSPFQSAGNVEFTGGSFSLGSEGGGDKSGRKFVKVRRDKHRAKK